MSRGTETRQRIIATSIPLFNTKGYAGTSMSDLLAAAGVEKGGLYNHFRSKEELALAAFDEAVAQVAARYHRAMDRAEGAVGRLVAFVEEFRRMNEAPPFPGGCPLLNAAVDADNTFPGLHEHARRALTDLLRLIGRTVRDGVDSGELRPEVDPRQVASITAATLEGAHMLSRALEDRGHMDRAVESLTALYRSLQR